MGASRKLQGEIDRVLKKISASYEQSLVDGWKLIKREMESLRSVRKRLRQKLSLRKDWDPKEKAKSETRAWLNNVVSELESQIDSFEAELEGVSVKKEKTRPPRLFMLALFGISLPTHHQSTSQEKTEDTTLPESNSETPPKAPPQKNSASLHSAPSTPVGGRPSLNVPVSNVLNAPVTISTSIPVQTSAESMGSLSPVSAKEEDATALPSPKPPSSVADAPLRGIAAEVAKRNIMGVESNVQPPTSPLSKMVLPPTAKGNDGTTSDINPSEVAASIGRAFSPSVVSGSQWITFRVGMKRALPSLLRVAWGYKHQVLMS
ncbi:unnamed protein product [Brassica napus]|uniref:(rape) hypothetical protein n=1 Tax=Brassica napus TaxID=3708 RepID=A0A816WDT4_BRANA|nr:unnamed protein product [Brassica napus]